MVGKISKTQGKNPKLKQKTETLGGSALASASLQIVSYEKSLG